MIEVMPSSIVNRTSRQGYCEVYAYSKAWPALFPQHGPGKKHDRSIELTDWQRKLVEDAPELLIRGLVQSDGCRSINTGRNWSYPRYSFTNLSEGIRTIFCDACNQLGLRWTRGGAHRIYISRKADVARMDEFVGPKA
jgi:hypothetical protein